MNKKSEMALDTFADMLIPLSNILSDEKISEIYKNEGKIAAVSAAIKKHKEDVISILAISDGVPVEDYEVSTLTLPAKVLKLLGSPEFSEAFTGQGQKKDERASGSATETTQGQED